MSRTRYPRGAGPEVRAARSRAGRRGRTPVIRVVALALAGVCLPLLIGGCGVIGVERATEQTATPDATVASDVKRALVAMDGVDAAAVRVVAKENRVTLDGFVASEEAREAMLTAAEGALGGYELVDELKVRQ